MINGQLQIVQIGLHCGYQVLRFNYIIYIMSWSTGQWSLTAQVSASIPPLLDHCAEMDRSMIMMMGRTRRGFLSAITRM